jgi:hypothetical protein
MKAIKKKVWLLLWPAIAALQLLFSSQLAPAKSALFPENCTWKIFPLATTPGYASKMGMPGGATTADWIMGGTVRPGAAVITRPAPPGPGGVNAGGNIEVVVKPGGIEIDWFHMPEQNH